MIDPEQPGESAYASAGVDYATLDAGKRLALTEALGTSAALAAHGGRALDVSRGEPAFVFELGDRTLAFVMEGLGTKAVASRQVAEQLGLNRFDAVAYDTVAAIVNDLCCVGALPLVVNAYFATGSSDWYRNAEWHASLVKGWSRACADAGATWGGGESPSLPGLVSSADIELAGSAVGALPDGRAAILGQDLAPGDEIVMVASSGLHANGASLARMIADRLPEGYATPLPSGRAYGDALLDPSILYAKLVGALAKAAVPVSYLSHVTGHGLLKLMRPSRDLTYRITALPPVPEVLSFLAEQAEMNVHAAYSTLNMGSGFAVYTAAGTGKQVVEIAQGLGHEALIAGRVEDGPRQVIVEPIGVVYADAELDLSPDAGK
ncbi:MAG: AIR synthase-related protein [Actinomycetota bacterium]|nr:AIR synthase-related protein [Actinomycetota bacterium]